MRLSRRDSSADHPEPTLILVKLNNIESANKIFRRRLALKDAGFANKHITRDKSAA